MLRVMLLGLDSIIQRMDPEEESPLEKKQEKASMEALICPDLVSIILLKTKGKQYHLEFVTR